jgi:hypothetical protein
VRKLGVVLVGLGVFLIVLGPLLRFYAYPRLAVAPKDQNSVSTLVGKNATIFDVSTLKTIKTDLTTEVATVGDVKAADQYGHNVVVWENKNSTKSSDGVVRSRSIEREAFNATSAEAVNCCGEYISVDKGVNEPVKHHGLLVKFPFFTEPTVYQFWDSTLLKTVPIHYVDTESVQGLTVYKFAQSIPPTKVGTTQAPRSVLGLPGNGNVTADNMYANDRTLWVEPVTGVVINRSEAQDSTLSYQGKTRLTTTKVKTAYDDKTVNANIDKYAPKATQLKLIHTWLPWGLPPLGLLLVLGGLVAAWTRRSAQVGDEDRRARREESTNA